MKVLQMSLLCGLLLLAAWGVAEEKVLAEPAVQPELRIVPTGEVYFICRAQNMASDPVYSQQSSKLFHDLNTMHYFRLDRDRPSGSGVGLLRSYAPNMFPPPLRLDPGERYVRLVTMKEVNQQFGLLDAVVISHGCYWQLRWVFGVFGYSDPIHVAFPDPQGEVASPMVDTLTRDYRTRKHTLSLAFIFHQEQPRELGFLVINSTEQDIVTPNALVGASSLIATSAAADFSQELTLPNHQAEILTVSPGEVAEWRLPWQSVRELIPAKDLERIKAAGGDLDLVWRTGELESSPLPLTMVVPEPSDHHQGDLE